MRDYESKSTSKQPARLPPWARRRWRETEAVRAVKAMLKELRLNTVCQSAGCPNVCECFSKPTATFLILGNVCTRGCRFCGVKKGLPEQPDADEPRRIGRAVKKLGLSHVVITSVTRDDLPDGGASHFAATVGEIRSAQPSATVEVLIPDFQGDESSLATVIGSGVHILNHNVETVTRLYPVVRPEAVFSRSLRVLRIAKDSAPGLIVKSGLMVGLGEAEEEVLEVFRELRTARCDALTVGQYMAPSKKSIPVKQYIHPETFDMYGAYARSMGFRYVFSGPFVRSSFNAEKLINECTGVTV